MQPQIHPGLQRLQEALSAEDGDLDPAQLALLVASRYYPDLDMQGCLDRLDDMAARARTRLGRARAPARVIAAINGILFEEEGFVGNVEDYYDPRNSFLNEVLERKTGIPISLSVVYLAVAHRLRQPVVGVGLPLHFIVKYVGAKGDIYIDPFQCGRVLTKAECQAQVERAYGAPVHFQDSYLDAVPTRLLLYRMLNNLKYVFLRRQDFQHAGQIVDQMLIVQPDQADDVRDRGLIYFQEQDWMQAIHYLTRYLQENPEASDADSIGQRLQEAHESRARLN
jgi:regulator of sirC expression with transglutaminase-like and TPR domain